MEKPQPILVSDLFPEILESLICLLNQISTDDWDSPTSCHGWTVKSVALHLLAVEISNLSRKRDGFSPQTSDNIRSNQDLVEHINDLNNSWIQATQRISTPLLVDLLQHIGIQIIEFFDSLDPFALGEPVSWAGPDPAPIWLDLAREYTERWHHQQHIRDALGKPGLKETRYFSPVLDAFTRALPFTYQETSEKNGAKVSLTIDGDSGGTWTIQREEKEWVLYVGKTGIPTTEVILDQEDAWRMFTKGVNPNEVLDRSTIHGDVELGLLIFEMVSIIA